MIWQQIEEPGGEILMSKFKKTLVFFFGDFDKINHSKHLLF